MNRMILVLIAVLAIASPAAADDVLDLVFQAMQRLEDRIAALESENEQLRERVAELENCCRERVEPVIAEDVPVAQVLRIESVNAAGREERMAEAARLVARARDIEQQAREVELEAAGLKVRPAPYSVSAQGQRAVQRWDRREQDRVKHQREQLRKQALDLSREVRHLRGRAGQLEREIDLKLQVIHGWDGSGMVMLETTRDWSSRLLEINAAGFITWEGRLIEFTEDGARYQVHVLRPAAPPGDFEVYQR